MLKEEYYLYGEKKQCESLAFILGLEKYKIISSLKKSSKKIIICLEPKKVKKIIKKNKLKHKKDYLTTNDIYKIINKGFTKKIVWIKYRHYINKHNLINIIHIIRPKINNPRLLEKIPVEFLKNSEMFIKTINSKQKNIECANIEQTCNIDSDGYIWGCCPGWMKLPFGNLLKEENPYNTYMANIIKLSSLNKTYCFCDFDKCKYGHPKELKTKDKQYKCKDYPEELTISIDRACNLKCLSCRKCYNTKTTEITKEIEKKLIDTKWLEKSKIVMAGQGEVFLSPVYRRILMEEIKGKEIRIFSNGTLFNKKNWETINEKYKKIYVSISVDAAKKETYKKLRCGNFDYLLKNLKMLGEHRKNNEIKYFELNFVVQKDNYKEIEDFIKLGEEIHVDKINFTKLNDWNTFSNSDFKEKSMINEKYLERELYDILKKIENKKIADITSFKTYLEESRKIYE